MIDSFLSVSVNTSCPEPFEDRIDILFHELELATKWQRPSVLLAIYNSDCVRADADIALENRLHALGQSAYHIKIKNKAGADVSMQISELNNLNNVVFFVEGLRWGSCGDNCYAYETLNNQREFFIENQIRVVFWLTEKEAIDLAHFAPDYWCFRHRVIEFVDNPQPAQVASTVLENTWQGRAEPPASTQYIDAKIALRTALLDDLPTGNESTAARANQLLTLGVLHWRKGEHEQAMQSLNTALDMAARLEDNCFEALCFNAIALVETDLGRPEAAIQAYQNAISLAPERITAWNNLGQLYRKLGRREQAQAAFQKAIEQNDSDALGWKGLGDLFTETARYDESIYAYLKAIEFAPDLSRSWSGLGNSYKESGQYDEALAAHRKAIELDPRSLISWLGLGDVFKLQGSPKNAGMAYRTALKLDPKNPLAWNELGSLFFAAGKYDEAMRSYIQSIESGQCGYLTYSNLASIYAHKGMHTHAVPLLRKAIELVQDPDERVSLSNRLGDAYRRSDEYDHALEAYRQADSTTAAHSTAPVEDPPVIFEGDLPEQADAALETEPTQVPVPVHDSSPVSVRLPDAPTPGYEEIDSSQPDPEFVSWLNGLASAQAVAAQPEPAATSGLNQSEDSQARLEAGTGIEPARGTATLLDGLEAHQAGPESGSKPAQVLSYIPFEQYAASVPNRVVESTKMVEEEVVMLNDATGSASPRTSAPQADLLSGEQTHQSQASLDQKNALIWNELGNIYYNAGAFDEALHAFEMAIELDPSYGWSYNNLASIYYHQKRYAEAIPLYQKGLMFLDDLKDKALLWNRLGDAYKRLDNHDQAAAAYRKAIELDSDNVSLLTRARFSLLGNLRV
jgi:tetratricopeptide (TPR) repeat protein